MKFLRLVTAAVLFLTVAGSMIGCGDTSPTRTFKDDKDKEIQKKSNADPK